MLKDRRLTVDVDETRCTCNRKPFRGIPERNKARGEAFKPKTGKYKGTFLSYAFRLQPECTCGAEDRKRKAVIKADRKRRERRASVEC